MRFSNSSPDLSRRKFLRDSGIAGATALSGISLSMPARAQQAPSVPSATVRLASNPYTNHAWVVLASRQGFLSDVGITIDPPEPKIVLIQQSVPQLQNREIDVSTMYLGLVSSAIDNLPDIKPFFVYSYWAGNTILTAPDSGLKTVDDFLAEGMPWEDAARATMAQLQGQEIVVPPNPSTYPWMNLAYGFADMTMEDSSIVALEDPRAVQLAASGRIKLAAPGGAVQIYQLQNQAGWRPLMSTLQMLDNVPASAGSVVNNVLNYDCMITTQSYIDDNRDTVLRLCSAMYRTIEYMFGPNQQTALSQYAPFINANAGSDLDADAIKFIFEVLDPFFSFDDQEKVWNDPTYPLYYRNIYEFQLAEYRRAGTIEDRDYDLGEFFQARNLWTEMRDQRARADTLLASLEGQSLSDERKVLVDTARQHYGWYNFLDAVRFLEAAVE
jgi:ABC-type nitrate/sulfonate/bicarbonate transport system substrate-binding protein